MLQSIKTVIFRKNLIQENGIFPNVTELWQKYRIAVGQNWITIITTFFSVSLCLCILYMLLCPLPKLSSPDFSGEQSIEFGTTQARIIASLDTYLKALKTRDLFKPSVPIPSEKKMGKTTAQQLAERLQFLGTSGDERHLSALVFIPERGPAIFQIGDRVAEFILKNIEKDRLVLQLEDEQIILKR